ncbi:hypothetical protein SH467x_001370 [Pirellulaceae bacterium SH467]
MVWILLGSIPWWAEHGYPWKLRWGLSAGNASAYGDSFGWINSLFSGMALVGVIVAIYLQMHELAAQRREMVITQWELSRAAEAQSNAAILDSISGIREHALFVFEKATTESERLAASQNLEFCNEIQLGLLSNLVASMPNSGLRDVLAKRVRNYAIYAESLRLVAEWREAFKGVLDYQETGGQRKVKSEVIESSAIAFVITVKKGLKSFKDNCKSLNITVEEFDTAFNAVVDESGEKLKSKQSKCFQDLEKAINNLELKLVSESSIQRTEEIETNGS